MTGPALIETLQRIELASSMDPAAFDRQVALAQPGAEVLLVKTQEFSAEEIQQSLTEQ